MARWLVARFPGGEMTGYPQKIMVLGVSFPCCLIISTSQSRCFSILDLGTLWTESLKFTLFGLPKSLTGFFMSSSPITVFTVSLSAVPVRVNTGVPSNEHDNKIHYMTICKK